MSDETDTDIVVDLFNDLGARWTGKDILEALKAKARQLPDCDEKWQIIEQMERKDVVPLVWIPIVRRRLKGMMARRNNEGG